MKRRAFFKALGGAAVAGPQIARAAANDTLKHAGIAANGFGGEMTASNAQIGGATAFAKLKSILQSIGGLPDWKKRQIRDETRYVGRLDIDLASLQSVSPASKVRMQQERQYRQREQRALGLVDMDHQIKANEFSRKHDIPYWF